MQYESTNKIIYSFSLGAKLVAKRDNEGSGDNDNNSDREKRIERSVIT